MDDALMVFDEVTKQAWRRFRHDLADRMADLGHGEAVEVTSESLGDDEPESRCAPRLEFRREAGVVLGRVTCDCPDSQQGLDKSARRRLGSIGWSKQKSPDGVVEFVAGVELAHADQLAAMAVTALRDVFGVAHPAFLAGDVGTGEDPYSAYAEVGCLDEPLATKPSGREHLDELIDEALAPLLGYAPERDEDGDIAVVSGSAVVFVRTLPNASVIRVWAVVVWQVSEPDRARFEVEVLNRDHHFTKFQLVGDRVVADMHLLASPFVASHLRSTVTLMCTLTDQVDDDLAVRVGGRRFIEHGDDEPGDAESGDMEPGDTSYDVANEVDDGHEHPAFLTLLQLDADEPGSISPAMAAHICEYDKQRLLSLIRSDEEQEIEWLKARDEARAADDDELADVCEDSRAHAERTVALLRKALRYVIERELEQH